ncbi:Gfo/Idh/MocA family protein [Halogranum rubrum]|uniref:Oxidoreductase domain protein n=1 Tax=Halogranum salarium B-1 TaxID=1210908 RepID=J2ZW27_9EURY|nr:Gfo/Idh/MocA family oxidoreductase [Halogranum salarium]EJN57213.1 oxidoreductase domain protein [Halogranum salarium B-1]
MSKRNAETVKVGVIGVGSMGQNHVRIYRDLPGVELVGLYDAAMERAKEVAADFGTRALTMDELLEQADAVSIAVPTQYHFDAARECIDAGVSVLVEKPFVEDPKNGQTLIDFAEERGVVLQVGHVERFNPAVRTLMDIVDDLDVIAVTAERLGPPLDREIDDSAVMDLMIHDIDIVLALVGEDVHSVNAVGTQEGAYGAANLQFEDGTVAELTASRVTQEKVRQLTISAAEARVKVDYIDQSIEIHRQSAPEYVEDGDVRYRHENVVEKLTVDQGEPLKKELTAFTDAVRTGSDPVVSGEDGLRALEVTRQLDELAATEPETKTGRSPLTQDD